jgi:hypothetical protein
MDFQKNRSTSYLQTFQNNLFENNNVKKKNNLPKEAPIPTYTEKQKEFGKCRPVREYTRFPKTRVALTGMDFTGTFSDFIYKDQIAPLKRPNLYSQENIKNNNLIDKQKEKWALQTTARAPDFERLPKFQQYKTYYFPPEYNNKNVEKYRQFSLKTDHIGLKVPKIEKTKPENSFVKLKSEFYFNTETLLEDKWQPFKHKNTNNNISSKDYNIISFQPNKHYAKSKMMNKTLNNRKKGIGEYNDLTKTYRININKDYNNKYNNNPNRFHIFTGIFSNMYDVAHKNGNIIRPFGNGSKN